MFPNVRLLIAAVLVSVVALSCGFGVFAALGVNREPLRRLPAGATALQLVAKEAAAASSTWGAPFGPGFRMSEAKIGAVITDASIVTPTRHETSAPPKEPSLWAAGTLKAEATETSPAPAVQPIPISAVTATSSSAAPRAAEQPAPTTSVPQPPSPPAAAAISPTPSVPLTSTARTTAQKTPSVGAQGVQPAPDAVTTAAEDKPAAAAAPRIVTAEPTLPPAPDVVTKAAEEKPAAASAPSVVAAEPAANLAPPSVDAQGLQPAPDAVTKAAEDKPAAAAASVAAVEPTANAAASDASPADVTGTVPDADTPEAKMPGKLMREPGLKAPRKVVRRPIDRRIAKRRPVQPTVASATYWSGNGTATFQDPVFATAPNTSANAPVRMRRTARKPAVIKKVVPIKKTATTTTTPANPSAWPTTE